MAITINQQPQNWVFARNRVIYNVSSGNVANTGFRFVFEVEIAGETTTYLVPPNPSNRGIIDLSPLLQNYLSGRIEPQNAGAFQTSIHEVGRGDVLYMHELAATNTTTMVQLVSVTIKEGWIISGVFTPTAVGQATDTFVAHHGGYLGGYYFMGEAQVNTAGGSPLAITGRDVFMNLYDFDKADTYGFSQPAGIKLPVFNGSTESGILTFITDDGTYHTFGVANYKLRGIIYEDNGTPNTVDLTFAGAAGQITHVGCYPYNLNGTSSTFIVPSSYPDYRFYTIQLLNAADNSALSPVFAFYPKEYHCKLPLELSGYTHEPTRIAWVGDYGNWEYMNFPYRVQATSKVERKRYKRVVGDFSGTTYSANEYDRGLTEVGISNSRTIELTSEPLDNAMFKLASSLLRSKQVFMLNNFDGVGSGAIIPVVVETDQNVEHRPLDSRLRSLTITVRESNALI